MNKESFKEFENDDYKYIRLACSIASKIIYEEDPKKHLEELSKTYKHGIIKESLCISKTMSEYKKMEKFQNKQIYEDELDKDISKYLVCNHQTSSDSKTKRLIVAFRGTENMKDVFADLKAWGTINDHQGRFHFGFYKRAELIETEFFLNKLIKEDYEIVFTGHSLGAAIAALVAVKVLLGHGMTKELAKKVLFIGFGCPLVADNEFKAFLKSRPEYEKRFHFYQNGQDIVVDLLNISSFILYDSSEFIIEVLFSRSTSIYSSFFEKFSKALNLVAQAVIPEYRQFGYLIKLDGNKPTEIVDTSEEACITYIKNLIDNIKTLKLSSHISKVQNHYMGNYFNCIKDFSFKIDELGKIDEAINPLVELPASLNWVAKKSFDEVKIAKEANASYFVEIFKEDIDNSRIIIYIKCANSDNIVYNFVELDNNHNMEYLELEYFDSQETASGKCYSFHFECSSKDLSSRVKSNLRLYLFSSFNYVEISLTGEIDIKPGPSKRTININSMPIDELYLHAAYYIKLFQTDSSVEKIKTSEKINYEKNCEELKKCFSELNDIWDLEKKNFSTIENLCMAYSEYKPIENIQNSKSLSTKIIDSESIELFSTILPSVVMLKTLQAETKDDSSIWRVVKYPLYPLLILLKFIHRAKSYWSEQKVKKDEDYRNLVKCICRDNGFSVELDSDSDQIAKAEQFISNNNRQLIEKKYKSKEIQFKNAIKSIRINYKIRSILLDGIFVGVIGTSKSGKSTLVNLITQKETDACKSRDDIPSETKKCKPYQLNDELIVIDYPHFTGYREQFRYFKYILDYAIFVCNSEKLGDTYEADFLDILNELANDWIRFTLVFNNADNTFKDAFNNHNYKNECINNIERKSQKKELRKYEENIIWSWMKDMTHKDLINQDKLIDVGVLNGEGVSEKIKHQIGLICPRSKELVEATKRNNKNKWVQFRMIKGMTEQRLMYKLTLEEIINPSEKTTYNNLQKLKEVLRDTNSFNLMNPIIKAELDPNEEIRNFEDFFTSRYQCYIVSEASTS